MGGVKSYLGEIGDTARFAGRFFREGFKPRYELGELIRQCYCLCANAVAIYGGYLGVNIKGVVSWHLYWTQVFRALSYGDFIPSLTKTIFFGFTIGIIGCYKGYNSKKGTEGVGQSANSAVVVSSLLI